MTTSSHPESPESKARRSIIDLFCSGNQLEYHGKALTSAFVAFVLDATAEYFRSPHTLRPVAGTNLPHSNALDDGQVEYWDALAVTAAMFHRASVWQTSITSIVGQLFNSGLVLRRPGSRDISSQSQPQPETVTTRSQLRNLVFAYLGWGSMLFSPQHPSDPHHFWSCNGDGDGSVYLGHDTFASRPIGALFGACSVDTSIFTPGHHSRGGEEAAMKTKKVQLEAPLLHYYTLKHVGRIKIHWVDSLDRHLSFESSQRRLSLFRFPSFCLANIKLGPGNAQSNFHRTNVLNNSIIELLCFYNITNSFDDSGGDFSQRNQQQWQQLARYPPPHQVARYLSEVLQSYHLLFGRDKRSRKLFTREIRPSLLRNNGSSSSSYYDHALDELCGRKHFTLPGIWSTDDCLEREVYDLATHFPMLGERLYRLQDFTRLQSPSRLRGLWQDRRNPLQWFTFWAVIIIGGLSLLIGLLQLLVSVAQLAVSARQTCFCG